MNIGVVVDNDLNNDKRILREIDILREDGNNICVLCFGFDKKVYNSLDGIEITRIRIARSVKNTLFFFLNFLPVYDWMWTLEIKKFIIENNIDIIHAHDLYMSKCSYTGIRQSGKKVKIVLDLHENFAFAVNTYNWTKGFLRSIITRPGKWQKKEKEYLGYPDKIVVLSDDYRDVLTARYPFLKPENFCVLPNVPDLKKMNSFVPDIDKIPFKKKAPILFYFGVVAERRGIFDALTAFRKIVSGGYDIDFMIIGPVDKKDLHRFNELISSDTLRERVIYIPWIDLSELPAYLEISDICIAPFLKNPQHESGVANKIYDYMLGKKPIIASDCRPQQKLIEKYNCGIVFHNENELYEAIIKLIGDSELRKKMGENGYNAVIKEFNTGKIKENLIRLYRGL